MRIMLANMSRDIWSRDHAHLRFFGTVSDGSPTTRLSKTLESLPEKKWEKIYLETQSFFGFFIGVFSQVGLIFKNTRTERLNFFQVNVGI